MARPTPEEMARLSEVIGLAYGKLDLQLIIRLVTRLVIGPPPLPANAEQWRIEKLLQAGQWRNEVVELMQQALGKVPSQVDRILYETAIKATQLADTAILDKAMQQGIIHSTGLSPARTTYMVSKLKEQALDQLNLVNTSMIKSAEQAYYDVLNQAAGALNSSDISLAKAITTATRELQNKGFRGFVDRRGRRWNTQSAVEMIMRTNVNSVATQAAFSSMDDMGADLIITSSHLGARPKCFLDQGQIFDRRNIATETTDAHGQVLPVRPWADSSFGEPDGMLGINCRHHIGVFIPGMSENLQKEYDFSENDKYYQAEQKQRGFERQIRNNKMKAEVAQVSGDYDAQNAAKQRVRQSQANLRAFLKETGLPRSRAREQIAIVE